MGSFWEGAGSAGVSSARDDIGLFRAIGTAAEARRDAFTKLRREIGRFIVTGVTLWPKGVKAIRENKYPFPRGARSRAFAVLRDDELVYNVTAYSL